MTQPSRYVLEMLRDDQEFILYRSLQPEHPSRVLVLAPVGEQPAPASLKRLEHEFSLAAELDSAWAAKPLALTRHEGRLMLVLEDLGGKPLDRALGRPLEITRFLRISIGLAAALGQVHRRGLIHKDIKPANVLVDDSGTVRLTGFGIASRLPRERQAPAPPEVISGTLAYMAPEQTGRMNRSIDVRSDLYSLGITLYEMLTGHLPFVATNPLEWVHYHIARQPSPPGDLAAIPGLISDIVMKLLSKTSEERYQSSVGLEADLRRCLAEWESQGYIEPFRLGSQDRSDRLLIPEKLYGRESEIARLLVAFDRVVAHGKPEFVLVSGYSGIGKSSVVHELHKALVPPRGLFATGKFEQYKRDIPYATLAQAFRDLVRQLLSKSEVEVRQWRDALQDAVNTNGQLIVNLVPELTFIIGEQPAVPDVPAQEAQNRFHELFRRFLGVFARPEHPLALFLDDLQWLDAATLELLEYLATEPEVRNLLLVGAYRNNEVSTSHPLMRTLDSIRKAGTNVHEIVITPLALDDVCRLIADALQTDWARARPLAQLVQEKTSGNPFFVIQFVTALADEALLKFDPDATAWTWDLARIRAKGYTDNVVDLMSGKLNRLPDATQEVLKQFACLGNTAETATLRLVHSESEAEVHSTLTEAVRAGLVVNLNGGYTFLHDRVQEAAYALIPEEQRPAVHLHIGRVLVANVRADEMSERVFDVVNQFNRGAALLSESNEKDQVAELNLIAGRKAKASTAYVSACAYLAAGMDLLGADIWDRRYQLAFELGYERSECEFLSGQFDKAENLIAELLKRVGRSKIDKAAAYRLKILLHIMRAEYRQAVDSGLECLRQFDITISAHPTNVEIQFEYEAMWRNLGDRSIESLIDVPLMVDPEKRAIMQLLVELVTPGYFTDNNLFYMLVYHMVNMSLQYGTTDTSAQAYAWLAIVLGPVLHRYRDGYRFGKLACDIVEKHGFIGAKAKTYLSMEMVLLWTHPIEAAIDFLRLTFRAGIETGDLAYACYSCDHTVTDLFLQGVPLDEVWSESQKGLEFVRKVKFLDAADTLVCQQQFILNMRGQTRTFHSFSDDQFDEDAFEARLSEGRMTTMVCCYWILKLQARFLSGDYQAAAAAAQKAKALLWSLVFHIQAVNFCFYNALTIAALDESAGPNGQAERVNELKQSLEQLREWTESRPETFLDKYNLVAAELARIEGRDLDATHLYEQSITAARDNGFVQNEAVANELAARFYSARGLETIAHAYLRNARYGYLRWGADGKVCQLDEIHPHLRDEQSPPGPISTIGTQIEHLDLTTVVQMSQAVSGEILLEQLVQTLIVMALEHAGAERGLLILQRGDQLQIEAEATTSCNTVEVQLRQAVVTPADLPESVLQYVVRTQESVVLDNASVPNQFSADEYIRQRHSRSVLCLPLVKQAKLIAVLYLENDLTPHVFTPARLAVLDLLASQAAISLENARLYADLQQENSERKLAENELRRSQAYLAEAQGLSNTGSFGWSASTGELLWSEETFRIFQYDRTTKPTKELVLQRVHPEDAAIVEHTVDRALKEGKGFDLEHRLLMPDGSVKFLYVKARASVEKGDPGNVEFFGSVMDITERKQRESLLRESEQRFRAIFSEAGTGISLVELAPGMRIQSNRALQTMLGCSSEELSHVETYDELTREEERESDAIHFRELCEGKPDTLRQEKHFILKNGKSIWANVLFTLLRDSKGRPRYVIAMHEDITELKQAEELVRQEERELRELVDVVPHLIGVLDAEGRVLHVNRAGLEYLGLTHDQFVKSADPRARIYQQEDLGAVQETLWRAISQGTAGEVEARMRRYDGQYRWNLIRYEPFRDEHGRVIRWYGTGTDIEDRKRSEQRMIEENLALREEIDKASMFEEIVGTSDALKAVLVKVSKVAPTDSTVLITGETGTGKELIARAIHKRSHRSARAFVSVNCAAIPPSLIASELFGHEKGAFTGANQRRIGRFELADGGTIFLDEIGDLPLDTQLALLRVLQEREFERVGGTRSISVNVRVIAATNRDLEAAMADGEFRSDLYYRLNVFPLDVPPLRARREDIPLLVEYFIDRFATKAGKDIRQINKRTLELLQSYAWPGNIRELQNVVERSVIVCEGDSFSVDESWLARETVQTESTARPLIKIGAVQEKEMIKTALAATRGRVSGRWGAAVMLGIPSSTLESKIKALKIDKQRFKTSTQKS